MPLPHGCLPIGMLFDPATLQGQRVLSMVVPESVLPLPDGAKAITLETVFQMTVSPN